jgi:hypothetical protein
MSLFPPFRPYLARARPPDTFVGAFDGLAELSIEVFTLFECFLELLLPPEFADAFECVYRMRGALECDAVADGLHVCVTQVFQCGFPRRAPIPSIAETFSVSLPDFRKASSGKSSFKLIQGDGLALAVSPTTICGTGGFRSPCCSEHSSKARIFVLKP